MRQIERKRFLLRHRTERCRCGPWGLRLPSVRLLELSYSTDDFHETAAPCHGCRFKGDHFVGYIKKGPSPPIALKADLGLMWPQPNGWRINLLFLQTGAMTGHELSPVNEKHDEQGRFGRTQPVPMPPVAQISRLR